MLSENILDIINEENESMIGLYEDDWILSQEVKINILTRLNNYMEHRVRRHEKAILNKIINLLIMSIDLNHNLYFLF